LPNDVTQTIISFACEIDISIFDAIIDKFMACQHKQLLLADSLSITLMDIGSSQKRADSLKQL